MDVNTNMDVPEAAIPQIVAIRYCAHLKKRIRVPPFRYLGCVLQCAVFPHTSAHHTLRSLLLFFHFSLVKIYHQVDFETRSKNKLFLALVKPNPVKTCLRQGASSGPPSPAGRGGVAAKPRPVSASPKPPVHWSGPVYWHMTQPVHTVLARATRAQPYSALTHYFLYNVPVLPSLLHRTFSTTPHLL